jgi:hypothetical protein
LNLIKVHSSLLSARHGTPTGRESGLSESRVFRKWVSFLHHVSLLLF